MATSTGRPLRRDGTVWVWGEDGSITGTFGTNHTTPVQVPGIQDVTAIAAGGQHLLMLKSDKTVWSIGVNVMGQLGDGTTTNRTTPVQVAGLSNVARIAAGQEFSVARKEDGTIWAWGINFSGQLGPGGGSMDFSAASESGPGNGIAREHDRDCCRPGFLSRHRE